MGLFYIYQHIRLDTNIPFYVGKGKGSRAYIKFNRNKKWKNLTKTVPYRVEFLHKNLTEEESFVKEIEIIRTFKLKNWCECNIHPGGPIKDVDQNGTNNHMYGMKGNRHPNYNRKVHSEEQKRK